MDRSAHQLTISGGDANRCLQVDGGNGGNQRPFTFADGWTKRDKRPPSGGRVENGNGPYLTLNDCSFSAEQRRINQRHYRFFGYGGGVVIFFLGQLNINRCTFADNTAGTPGEGSGIWAESVIVTNSTFTRRTVAPNGSAISSSSSLDLHSSTREGNEATLGGMVWLRSSTGAMHVYCH